LPILFEGGKNIGKCGKRIKTKEKVKNGIIMQR
jgi:hypothetical protein